MKLALRSLGVAVNDDEHITDHHVDDSSAFDDTVVLFIDVKGRPFFPVPDTVDERDRVHVVVIGSERDLAGVEQTELKRCDRLPVGPRVSGSLTSRESGKSSGILKHRVITVGRCAGSDSEGDWPRLEGLGEEPFSYPVNPVYHISIGVGLGFDDTNRRDLRAHVRPGDTVPTITEESDRVGLTTMAVISLYPLGRDFRKRDFLRLDRILLFAGVDLERLDQSLLLGAGYELFAGLNLLVGIRVLTKNEVLRESAGLRVGDTFDPTRGDLPTRERWESGSYFIGVSATDDLLQSLK